jgi:eukaryotic-like serine/threonine-protein kinase
MQPISSFPTRGASANSRRTKPSHRAAVTTYRVVGSAGRGSTNGKVAGGKLAGTSHGTAQRRYQARELLGSGGMSEVYRGFDAQLRRPVAIKRLRPDLAMNPVFRARFRREAEAAGRLSHPAIVAVYDTGEEPDPTGSTIPFIVMELVEGRSLRDVLRNEGRVAPGRALELTAGVLDALACSHAAGIIHRDIKPGNVMLTNARAVKVADFGIARAVSDASGTATMAGTVIGTAQYLSPEQGRGESADVRSDLYSVGCLLYELLVGEPPFTGDSMVGIVFQHISEPPTPPSSLNEDISTDVDAILLKALAKAPADRYQSAAEMKADVESVLSGHPPAATVVLPAALTGSPPVPDYYEGSTNRPSADQPSFDQPSLGQHSVERLTVARPRVRRLIASLTGLLLVVAGASAFGIHESSQPEAAASTTTQVPAVLGLGQVGVESLLRNADLVPEFKFVYGADDASIYTAVRQSPESGDVAAVDSTVTVVINLGPVRETVRPKLVARDGDFQASAGQPNLASDVQSSPGGSSSEETDRLGGSHDGKGSNAKGKSGQTGNGKKAR